MKIASVLTDSSDLQGDEILKSCWCEEGHMRIPESRGCYDPIRKVVTLKDACFADYHCNDLPNTVCAHDTFMDRYNRSCQCLPGNKPFEPNPRTGETQTQSRESRPGII